MSIRGSSIATRVISVLTFRRAEKWYKKRPIVVPTRFQKHRNRIHSERGIFEKRVCPLRRGRGILYTSCAPAGTKSSRLSPLEDFAPSSCGERLVFARARANPIPSPRPGKRCRRKQGVIPSRANGRRRYNTLDLASKIVCHGNSLFPLDPLVL